MIVWYVSYFRVFYHLSYFFQIKRRLWFLEFKDHENILLGRWDTHTICIGQHIRDGDHKTCSINFSRSSIKVQFLWQDHTPDNYVSIISMYYYQEITIFFHLMARKKHELKCSTKHTFFIAFFAAFPWKLRFFLSPWNLDPRQ